MAAASRGPDETAAPDAPYPVPYAALVTDGAGPIGRALALALADAGFAVAVHHRGAAVEAAGLTSEIGRRGGRAATLEADLASERATAALVARAEADLGPIGVLVNSAGVFEDDTIETATRASWDRHLETNLRAPFVLMQEFARRLPAAAGGVVVNILDRRVVSLTAHHVSYTVAASGLATLTRTLALALAPRIRVNGIRPGLPLAGPRFAASGFTRDPPPAGTATPGESARALRFILDTPAMTGEILALHAA